MSGLDLLAATVLVLLFVTVLLGLSSLTRWLRHRTAEFPRRRVTAHVALQLASIALWVLFLVNDSLLIAWLTFVTITIGQTFGDRLMFASYRARRQVSGPLNYGAVARDVLGFSRPVAALHAIIGAAAYFTMLVTCILASVQ
ncbi:hypothetical protein [Gulosibacter faecalis]|uniref:Uncharacterized protein n=1 Tax=Gulosibacter faecalis TaxID=272240 RepID=A0ABW5UV55_9MICO|nr:hypothetical protein [Gulosibacter faecalis]